MDTPPSRSEYQRNRRLSMTPEEKQRERERKRDTAKRRRLSLTPLQRFNHLARNITIHPAEHYLETKSEKCVDCGATHFFLERKKDGKFSSCCASGSVRLTDLRDYPNQLRTYLKAETDDGKNFHKHIRKYNNAFAFASFGYQPAKLKGGPPALVIHGQVYHRTSVGAENKGKPLYSQLYFLDPDYANSKRQENEHNAGCRDNIFKDIDGVIRSVNPYAHAYKMMKDIVNSSGKEVQMWITKDRQQDPRRYNLPIANEVAAVFVSEDGEPPFERDICVYLKDDSSLQNIKIISPNCDPMTYPLLFPYGEFGWQPGIPLSAKVPVDDEEENFDHGDRKRTTVSMLEFYSYRLQDRAKFSPLLNAGKLTQQYIVDAFLKVEGTRLEWNRTNQKNLRVELYLGLMDYVNSQAERKDLKPGRMVILPSSFSGGKRALQQNYQDAMVLVAKFGKPDLFITFTCNPRWKEITETLKAHQTAIDRPDIVATVFKLKLKEFMDDVVKRGVLGKVKAYLSVIEFQKRGLPHCHMLFILEEDDKLRELEDVDTVVCAEIPDENNETLFEIVKTCMIHGPCGELNTTSPCMEEEKGVWKCTKGFPKEFSKHTNMNVDGYPVYRRRNNGKTVTVRNQPNINNQWVVPYNPYPSQKFNAHINVEVCSTVQSVKYIFKYIYKGHDAAIVKVNDDTGEGVYNWDEVQTFLDTRYIAAPEAVWRLRKYNMTERSHAVERLPVHLPSQQTVVFEDGAEHDALRKAEEKGTKLTKWFLLNQKDSSARNFLYTEIPYHFVWRKCQWQQRKIGGNKILPRMYSVSPKDMERFCLRLLLLHVKGARCFEDLRKVEGVVYQTFKEAAKALNLLEDDQEWLKTMEEAVVFRMPSELRNLFAAILINGPPTDEIAIYNRFKNDMYEDFLLNHSEHMAEQLALKDIEDNLLQFGKTCQSFKLPSPTDAYEYEEEASLEIERMEAVKLKAMMNAEQCTAFGIIMDAVEGKGDQQCFFLSGAGGCGKTFVYKALITAILSQGGLVRAVAPTGLASTLLRGGRTVHSGFGIPINLNENTTSRFTQRSSEFQQLSNTKLIIWDEISMCHAHLLNAVDRSLRFLFKSDKPFGGIPIVVGGDFRQQAPVVLHGNRVQVVEACVKSSTIWKEFKQLSLITNMRVQEEEKDFSSWLLSIGDGKDNGESNDFVKLPPEILSNDIVESVFGDNINSLSPSELASRAVLCPKNQDTLSVNERVLSMLAGGVKTYFSIDCIGDCQSEEERAQYPIEFLHSLTPMGLPPHALNLKKGCCVMLMRNLNPKRGLCNGTRLIVESLGTNIIECSLFSGERNGEKVFIPRITLDQSGELPFTLKRKQFPLRLAYSMTITKSQGQTFDKIGLYLPGTVFTHGQLYTALSRVRGTQGLFVEIKEGSKQGEICENDSSKYTYNCVYREIL